MEEAIKAASTTTATQPTADGGDVSGVAAEQQAGEKKIGFTNPTDKEIYRAPTSEEQIAEMSTGQKTARQRHILDVAKKLDSNLRVVFVDNDAEILNNQKGLYVRDNNTIYIAKDLKTSEMYNEVFKHEFVHRLETKKVYQEFKNYLFNDSEAFFSYAETRLNAAGIDYTNQNPIDVLVDMYVNNFKSNQDIPQAIRDKFTNEKAEKEAVADFVARTLFKGNTADLRVALKDNMQKLVSIESDLDFFVEMATKKRGLLSKVIDAIKDFFRMIKGVPQFKTLEQDLAYIEEMLVKVYNSKDIKNTATDSGEVQYCSRNNTVNPFNPEGKSLKEQLQDAYETSTSFDQRYVYVGKFSQNFIDLMKENGIELFDYPIAMNYRDAYLSMRNKDTGKYQGEGINYHNLGVEGLYEALESFKSPKYIMKSKKDGKIELALQTVDKKGNNILSIIEINTITLNGNKMLNAHIVASAYGKRNIENYISKAKKKED